MRCSNGKRGEAILNSYLGTMLMTAGVDLYTTCKLMGHSDVRTTQIYAKIVDSKKIEAVNLVDRMFEKRNGKEGND